MDGVKYFYFTSIIWTIAVLSLLIVFYYNSLESLEFTVKSPCSERNATREQCLCSPEFCVNKCCAWGQEPVGLDGDMYVCNHTVNETVQRKFFSKSLQYYYTSPSDTAPKKIHEDEDTFKIYIDFLTSETTKAYQHIDFNGSVRLFRNGTAQSIDNDWYRSPSGYCLETFFTIEVFKFFYVPSDDIAINNTPVNHDCDQESGQVLRVASLSVSVFFFILTLLVYAVLPKLQTLRGKCLMCYFMCMLIACVGLLYFQLRVRGARYYVQTCAVMGEFSILFP